MWSRVFGALLCLLSAAALAKAITPVPVENALREGRIYFGWTDPATPNPRPEADALTIPDVPQDIPVVGGDSHVDLDIARTLDMFNDVWHGIVAGDMAWHDPKGYVALSGEDERACGGRPITLVHSCDGSMMWDEETVAALQTNYSAGEGAVLFAAAFGYGEFMADAFGRSSVGDLPACLAGVSLQQLPSSYSEKVSNAAREAYLSAAGLAGNDRVRTALDTGMGAGRYTCMALYR